MLIVVDNNNESESNQQLTGEMGQSLKDLPHKYKDLSLDRQHPHQETEHSRVHL